MASDTLVIRRGKGSIKLSGLRGIYARMRRVVPDAQGAGINALNTSGARAFAASQAQVPVDDEDPSGQLKASGRFFKARVSKRSGRVTATIGYGGARLARLAPDDNPLYAIVQHQDSSLRHAHGSDHFLERPVRAEKLRLMGELERTIGRAIARK